MGIFGKKKNDDFAKFHNENLFNDDDDILLPSRQTSRSHNVGQNGAHAPHAITVDELSGTTEVENIPMERPRPDSVYKRMMEREQQNKNKAIGDDYVPSWVNTGAEANLSTAPENIMSEKTEVKREMPTVVSSVAKPAAVHTQAPTHTAAPSGSAVETHHSAASDAFLERCREAVQKASGEDIVSSTSVNEATASSQPTAAEEQSRSVDEIIKMLRGKAEADVSTTTASVPAPSSNSTPASRPEHKPAADNSTAANVTVDAERKVEVEVIPMDSDSDIMHTTSSRKPESDVRVYGKIVKGTVVQQTPDGDVEGSDFVKAHTKVTQDTIVAEDKTIMFGDLGDIISKRAEDDMRTSAPVFEENDEDEEYDDYDDRPYYETEDPDLADVDDYKNLNDAARLRVRLGNEKSRHKTLTIFSSIVSVIMIVAATPLTKALPTATLALIELILLVATLAVNFDIFLDFKRLFKMRPGFDSCVSVASVVMLAQSACSAFMYDGKYSGLAIGAAVLLTVNRIAHLLKSSRVLKGLELIANSEEKRAVVSVEGKNAGVIASGAVEGEALVLCDRSTVNVKNYLKNCGYDSPFDRKIKALFICSASIAAVIGVVSGYFGGLGLGFTVAAALLVCMFPASAALICELPIYFASAKCADYGAMLAGYKGAYELNLANLVAVSSSDLFPEGSVKLYNMKSLAENEIGRTLMDAAAVAKTANSPLSAIFEGIIGSTGNKYPKVNGVQYEDKMGISGWIGERTILIGNRNLMQGHNITVPPASVDQKILRAGYFPVYIAVDGVPCLLFIVQYETDSKVAHELQVLCNTGMTVVVDPKDPNTTGAMICDYFGLPDDALRVMNHNGRVSYERTAAPADSSDASATFGKNICGFFSAVSSSIRLGGTYRIMTALFIVAAVLGAVLLGYLCLTGALSLLNTLTVAGFQVLFTVISAIVAKVRSSQ